MPSIEYDPKLLSADDDLWELFKTLKSRGWRGGVASGAEDQSPAADVEDVTTLAMHASAAASNDGILGADGIRRLTAKSGDMRVDTGNAEPKAITVMTQAAFTAMYGEETP